MSLTPPTYADHLAAVRLLGLGCPVLILAAQARCLAWRPGDRHTEGEVAGYEGDRGVVREWMESNPRDGKEAAE